jgi:hypothetical protein
MTSKLFTLALVSVLATATYAADSFTWVGVRSPVKTSAEDGVTKLGVKIGKFVVLQTDDEWKNVMANVTGKFPGARPWVTLAVGELPEPSATTQSVEAHEAFVQLMDKQGVDVYLEVWPKKTDVGGLIDTWLGRFKKYKNVRGFGVDLEFYKPTVDDATAQAWDEKIKAHNPEYRLFFKHWLIKQMPPTYRGKGDLIFICTGSEGTLDELNDTFAKWAAHFSPHACAFQIGYPADEDGMDGKNDKGWWKLKDPVKDWGQMLLEKTKGNDPKQQLGLIWVCTKSGKTYNQGWDLTKPAKK